MVFRMFSTSENGFPKLSIPGRYSTRRLAISLFPVFDFVVRQSDVLVGSQRKKATHLICTNNTTLLRYGGFFFTHQEGKSLITLAHGYLRM